MTTAFQPSAFQNTETGDHFGFQVEIVPSDRTAIGALTVDQTVQMTADQWELVLNSSDPWRARSRAGGVDLSTGLINALGDEDLVKHIEAGKVDEWELTFTADQLLGGMRGRDSMAYALDTAQMITYVSGGVVPPTTPSEELPAGLQPIPGVTTRLFLPGAWRASTVCRDLANRVGLTGSYQAPDYALRKDVEVNGPANAAIQQIIAPFCHFEPFKTDVWVEGKTLMVRQRQGLVESPGLLGPTPGMLNTVSVGELRTTQLKIRAHYLDFIRVLRVIGQQKDSRCLAIDSTADETHEAEFVQAGVRFNTVVKRHFRITDDATFKKITETYNLTTLGLETRETVEGDWEPLVFNSNCELTTSPKHLGDVTTWEERSTDDNIMRVVKKSDMKKNYDANGFIISQETVTYFAENTAGAHLEPATREFQTFLENGIKMWTHGVAKYSIDRDGKETLDDFSSSPGAGLRPGGPGRAPASTYKPGESGARWQRGEIVDNVPGAKDITITDDNLDQQGVNAVFEQGKASSGAMEYEVQFTAAQIPWVKKGMMLKITGLMYEDGVTAVDLPEFLVLDARIIHTEDSEHPSSLVQVKGVFWSKTYGGE